MSRALMAPSELVVVPPALGLVCTRGVSEAGASVSLTTAAGWLALAIRPPDTPPSSAQTRHKAMTPAAPMPRLWGFFSGSGGLGPRLPGT